MKTKKLISIVSVLTIILSCIAVSAFADGFSDEIPSDAVVYGAETCHYGFTTSRYITKGSGWNSQIHVSSTYVLWDDNWEFDNNEIVMAKNGNKQLSDKYRAYTGGYKYQGDDQIVHNPGTDRDDYIPYITDIELYGAASNYSKIYLRIENPGTTDSGETIVNMMVWGYFWK